MYRAFFFEQGRTPLLVRSIRHKFGVAPRICLAAETLARSERA
jgi:hypothetical protein